MEKDGCIEADATEYATADDRQAPFNSSAWNTVMLYPFKNGFSSKNRGSISLVVFRVPSLSQVLAVVVKAPPLPLLLKPE